ncbi:MAG: hypothetical protein ACYC99_10615 [Candidatus Geothermincolia bacterium]
MFKRKANQGGGGTALASRQATIIQSSDVVRIVGERIAQKMWPLAPEVHLSCQLPAVRYNEGDFWRLMEILIVRALSAFPPVDPAPQAIVGARCDGSVTIFSVHTPVTGAFSNEALLNKFSEAREYKPWEAKLIVERNGGRFWIDDRNGNGSTAYFTLQV